MPSILFYLFAILMITGGICVVSLKNPVSSAMGMIGSFIGLAALLIGLNAYFVGTLQVLVYAGAIMVLFIFIIMLLDLKQESRKEFHISNIAAGVIIPLALLVIVIPVFSSIDKDFKKLDKQALIAAEAVLPQEVARNSIIRKKLNVGEIPDVNLIGQKLFTEYNFPVQVVGVLLLVATIGCVTLSKKLHGDEVTAEGADDKRMAKTLARSSDIPQVAQLPTNPKKASESIEKSDDSSNTAESVDKTSVEKEPSKQIKKDKKNKAKKDTNTKSKDETKSEETEKPAKEKVKSEPKSKSKTDKESSLKESKKKTSKKKAKSDLPKHAKQDDKLGLIYSERPDDADDLTKIKGVGPVLEKKLNKFGIYTFKQISSWSPEIVTAFDDLLSFKGRIDRDKWVTQATDLHANKTK